ncbi:MAG: hypothetical protein PHE73_01500 [Sulfurovaceae bacterium]|nr:hypothetical protein [Sulfurovaceae bacterium]
MSQTIDELFESKSYDTFELGIILDIDIQKAPYYFMAVMINVKTKWNENILIPPEQLRSKYKVGYCYQNGKRVISSYAIKKDFIEIDISSHISLHRNSNFFNNICTVNDSVNEYNNKYFLKQLSYKIDMKGYILIVPSYTIALRYYFLSSSMKNAIMDGNLNELHYKDSCYIQDDCVNIHIKKKAGIKDLPFLCRFLINPQAFSRMKRHNHQRSNAKYPNTQILSTFPIDGKIGLSCSYKVLDFKIDEKPVYYVLDIQNDDSPLGFSKINYKRYSSKESEKNAELISLMMPRPNRFKKRDFLHKDNIARKGSPSIHNAYEAILEKKEKDLNTKDLIINGSNIYMPSNGSVEHEFVDETGSNSFEPVRNNGDPRLSNATYYETEYDQNETIFALNDFIQFYDTLMTYPGVIELDEIKFYDIEKSSNKQVRSKYIIKNTRQARQFLFSIFAYDDRFVYIIEIEQDRSWQLATWFFVSNVGEDTVYDVSFAHDIIQTFIDNDSTYKKLEEDVLETYSLTLIHHNHKRGDVDDIEIDSWCDGILNKILKLNNMDI